MGFFKFFFAALVGFMGVSPLWAGVSLKGTGSYEAAALATQWIVDYREVHPRVRIQYEMKNSSDGLHQWMDKGAEFALTDTPMSAEEENKIFARPCWNLPVAVEAVVVTYNLPGVETGLRITPGVLSGIFQGTIKKWNDPALEEFNPGVRLPDMAIRVLRRPEESALHDLFPDFLARTDPQWTAHREKEKNIHWPTGQGVRGDDKIYEKMRKWPGVIAAVDFAFAQDKKLPMAALRNEAGFFTVPTPESIRAASSDFLNPPEDFKVHLSGSRAPSAYPLSSFVYLVIYKDLFQVNHDHAKDQALVEFLDWVSSDGQKKAAQVSFEPLPESFRLAVEQAIGKIQD